jgi:hypothetical protein
MSSQKYGAIMQELTTIQVTKKDAAELKARFPELKRDALRVAALLGRYQIVKTDTLPHPADGQSVPVVYVQTQE